MGCASGDCGLVNRVLQQESQIFTSLGGAEAKVLVVADVLGVIGGLGKPLPNLWGSSVGAQYMPPGTMA